MPSRIFKFKPGQLEIEKVINARINSSRQPEIRSAIRERALGIARRALEVAIISACGERQQNPSRGDWAPAWTSIADAAKDSERAIGKVFRAIDPKGTRPEHFQTFIAQSRLGGVGYHRSRRDARILLAARQILRGLNDDTLRRRADLVAMYPHSFDFEKRAFVERLAEGWVFLTGVRPGKNRDIGKNAFLTFVNAGWIDWHQERRPDEGFGEALDAALSKLTDATVEKLQNVGPDWV